MRTLDEYLVLPYRITLTQDADDEGRIGWVAEVEELAGCLSQGETPEEAVANIRDAMAGWISVMLEDGKPIPEPRDPNYSGRVLLRMPATLHAELAREADHEGVSLNTFMTNALSGTVAWKAGNGRKVKQTVTSSSTARRGRSARQRGQAA